MKGNNYQNPTFQMFDLVEVIDVHIEVGLINSLGKSSMPNLGFTLTYCGCLFNFQELLQAPRMVQVR
jgi:hypothetical protein